MSEYDKPIREWNAVTYLRDFISTCLILSPSEQEVWDYVVRQNEGAPRVYFNAPTKPKKKEHRYTYAQYRLCQRCREIKPKSEFIGKGRVCNECKELEQKYERLRVRKRVSNL